MVDDENKQIGDEVCRALANRLSEEALLEQIAEECGELVQQCAKRLRILRGENPTPVGLADNYEHLVEELADVHLVTGIYELKMGIDSERIYHVVAMKFLRWSERLGLDIDDYLRE